MSNGQVARCAPRAALARDCAALQWVAEPRCLARSRKPNEPARTPRSRGSSSSVSAPVPTGRPTIGSASSRSRAAGSFSIRSRRTSSACHSSVDPSTRSMPCARRSAAHAPGRRRGLRSRLACRRRLRGPGPRRPRPRSTPAMGGPSRNAREGRTATRSRRPSSRRLRRRRSSCAASGRVTRACCAPRPRTRTSCGAVSGSQRKLR